MNIALPKVVAGWLNHYKMMKLSLNFALTEYYEGAELKVAELKVAAELDSWFNRPDNKERFKIAWNNGFEIE